MLPATVIFVLVTFSVFTVIYLVFTRLFLVILLNISWIGVGRSCLRTNQMGMITPPLSIASLSWSQVPYVPSAKSSLFDLTYNIVALNSQCLIIWRTSPLPDATPHENSP